MSNHEGGHDHSRDSRVRRCDACTRRYSWAELKEVLDPVNNQWGFWVCKRCLGALPSLKLVPRRPDWRDDPNNALSIMARSIKKGA